MGCSESRCAELLERMGWQQPQLADDFFCRSLADYLENQNLEIALPRHAPQRDLSMADRKPSMYPRPGFCSEGYKMHVALIGPSTACRNQFTSFLPRIANVFKGPPTRLGPGREAVPHYFLDDAMHRIVLWELPEIAFKQSCEDYVRELGLLYIDCVFMLFSDKYVVTDIYAKMCVTMALHGIPFFVICTMSGDQLDEKAWTRLKSDFQRKDIQVRMFEPNKPHLLLEPLITDFYKEISWNRSKPDDDCTKDAPEHILGQTVRLKNLSKKPEMNGKCGVCIGFDKGQSRYRVRIINGGVETDLALREECISILRPRLVGSMVTVHGLEARPELNGRYGFVDEFLRESERYRVFLPDRPGRGLALALKSANLQAVHSVAGATPIAEVAALPAAGAAKRAAASKASAKRTGGGGGNVGPQGSQGPQGTGSGPSERLAGGSSGSRAAAAAPKAASGAARPDAKSGGGSGGRFAPAARAGGTASGTVAAAGAAGWRGPAVGGGTASSGDGSRGSGGGAAAAARGGGDDVDLSELLPKRAAAEEPSDDLMSRIFAAEAEASLAPAAAAAPAATAVPAPSAVPRLRLSLAGLFSSRVWAVVGEDEAADEVLDHLMDCGKTVFVVGPQEEAMFPSLAAVRAESGVDVVCIVAGGVGDAAVRETAAEAQRLGVRGLVLHPSTEAFGEQALQLCRDKGLVACGADVLAEVQAEDGLAVAPLD